jgi:ATP-dependent DNA ligase
MVSYDSFQYIFPPRPKNAVDPKEIDSWDNGMMIGQPKLNGSNCVIFTNGTEVFVYNRHGQRMTNYDLNKEEVLKLYSGHGWMVLNGEYLNKSKKDESGDTFNHKLILFDILVYNSQYLLGTSFGERVELLDKLYGVQDSHKPYLFSISENVFRVKTYSSNFKNMFQDLTKIDMIEGLVLKRKSAKLEIGNTENNNTKSQIKFRKSTKNYKY